MISHGLWLISSVAMFKLPCCHGKSMEIWNVFPSLAPSSESIWFWFCTNFYCWVMHPAHRYGLPLSQCEWGVPAFQSVGCVYLLRTFKPAVHKREIRLRIIIACTWPRLTPPFGQKNTRKPCAVLLLFPECSHPCQMLHQSQKPAKDSKHEAQPKTHP